MHPGTKLLGLALCLGGGFLTPGTLTRNGLGCLDDVGKSRHVVGRRVVAFMGGELSLDEVAQVGKLLCGEFCQATEQFANLVHCRATPCVSK